MDTSNFLQRIWIWVTALVFFFLIPLPSFLSLYSSAFDYPHHAYGDSAASPQWALHDQTRALGSVALKIFGTDLDYDYRGTPTYWLEKQTNPNKVRFLFALPLLITSVVLTWPLLFKRSIIVIAVGALVAWAFVLGCFPGDLCAGTDGGNGFLLYAFYWFAIIVVAYYLRPYLQPWWAAGLLAALAMHALLFIGQMLGIFLGSALYLAYTILLVPFFLLPPVGTGIWLYHLYKTGKLGGGRTI